MNVGSPQQLPRVNVKQHCHQVSSIEDEVKVHSICLQYGNTGCGVKLERFLPKNQHTQRKFLNVEYWTNGEPQ